MDKKGIKKVIGQVKVNYPKLTFRLSVFGFIASLAFYIGVLRDLRPTDQKERIEQLTTENRQLKKQVVVLTDLVEECQNDE